MKPKHRKRIYILLSMLLVCFLGMQYYAPRVITEIKNPIIIRVTGKNYEARTSFHPDTGYPLNFSAYDGIQLSAFFTASRKDFTKGTIILLHGIRGTKEHFIPLSERLSKLGYNAVALDSRAHGQSTGVHCTFGVKEKRDISKLIDLLISKGIDSKTIGIWGQSLGGAIGLQAMAQEPRIAFGIIESTFRDLHSITNDYFNYHAGFKNRFFINYLLQRAGKIADFNPNEASPITACKKITQPVLLVHGTADRRITIAYAKENFKHIASTSKTFIPIEGANHLNVWTVGGTAYFKTAEAFLNSHTANSF